MADRLDPNPGFVFRSGAEQTGEVWITELIRIVNKRRMPFQADSTATTVAELKDDFNDLLAKLKAAGLMETS